ncbi:LysR family transcriptional regulator [Rhodobacteraceae bacterium B1Z28]|uniref:LysR family transcriptional regulator n=1 Tax=Ruegeria haliotis TaxID=2747601 RepID=A0ABX2PT84_9RHOB|nr:LysR family transcriptional regulator [Ruegeria haliotis]NVO56969.1 LysR family transcriptional regulator [Ruegeria haliotis]
MDHVSRVGVFIAVVKAESFAGAARALGITSSAVSKQIQNLEQDLQVKLLNRTTRKVSVTEEGAVFFEGAARALEDLQEAQEQIYELKSRPRGRLKISLPQSLGKKYFGHMIASFAAEYPEVELDVSLDDRIVDIVNENFDLALRIGSLQDTSLIARRMASCPFVLCASATYLEVHGTPKRPADLVRHNVLEFTGNSGLHEWRFKDANGQIGQVSLTGNFKSDSGDILCRAAQEGVGIALLPIFYVAEYIENQELCAVLPDHVTWPNRDIYVIFQPSRFQSTRQRLFVDHLISTCKQFPWEC